MGRPKKSPRNSSPQTKRNQLEFVFSDYQLIFDNNVLPKESDVISVWISKYDQARGDKRQMSAEAKVWIL